MLSATASASASTSTTTGKRLRSDNSFTSVDDDDVHCCCRQEEAARQTTQVYHGCHHLSGRSERLKECAQGEGRGRVKDVGSGDGPLKPFRTSLHQPSVHCHRCLTSTADWKQFEALVSTSVAAQLAPLLATISILQTELQLVKAAVAKLSTQVNDTADTLLAATTAAVAATASSATSHGFGCSDSSTHASLQQLRKQSVNTRGYSSKIHIIFWQPKLRAAHWP